jgi:hypothetical protein
MYQDENVLALFVFLCKITLVSEVGSLSMRDFIANGGSTPLVILFVSV